MAYTWCYVTILRSLVSDPHMEHATKWHHGDMCIQEDKLCAHPNTMVIGLPLEFLSLEFITLCILIHDWALSVCCVTDYECANIWWKGENEEK